MGKSTEPPKCKTCGVAHRGPCFQRDDLVGGRQGGKTAIMNRAIESALDRGITVMNASTGEVRGPDAAKDITPKNEPESMVATSEAKAKGDGGSIPRVSEVRLLAPAAPSEPKRGRGRPATGFDKKAYDREKAKKRRADVRAAKLKAKQESP